ncbi:MAG: hypothetical protein A2Y24_02325 [Clostridiales bacterium GWE2_32_10]|nr:MAG: hypothetical protein A2Y24_02325 [Clostridiales bacterium GWE2_32_10]
MESKRICAFLLSATMLITSTVSVNADNKVNATNVETANVVSDISDHWAKAELSKWLDKALIKGYEDDTVKPNNSITRAEFFALVNRVFNFKDSASISFDDVKSEDWYYDIISKAVAAGYTKGYSQSDGYSGHVVLPNNNITRSEAATILARTFELVATSQTSLNNFTDNSSIPDYAKANVAALLEKSYIKGYEDKTFKASNNITRAEAVKMIDNVMGELYSTEGEYTGTYKNVTVNTSDVTLKNEIITGDLYLTQGIGDGDITLDGVTVTGDTVIKGGGINTITIKNSKFKKIKLNKQNSNVRLLFDKASQADEVNLESGGTIERETGSNLAMNIVVANGVTENAGVTLRGAFTNVDVQGGARIVTDATTVINSMTIQSGANGTSITGGGNITTLQNSATGVTAGGTSLGQGTSRVNGGVATTTTTTTTTSSSGGSGGGGGGGSNDDDDTPTDTTKPTMTNMTLSTSNTSAEITFSEDVYTNNNETGVLTIADFDVSISGGTATLDGYTVTHTAGAETATITLTIDGIADGDETLTITPASAASIYDAAGNEMLDTQSRTADLTEKEVPEFVSASVSDATPNKLVVVFNEAMTLDDTDGLSLGGVAVDIEGVTGSGSQILTFTLSRNIVAGEGFTLSYDASLGSIEDEAGNALDDFTDEAVTNNVGDDSAPTLQTVTVEEANPNKVVLTLSEDVQLTDGTGFVITVEDEEVTVTNVALNADEITFTIDTVVANLDDVTILYDGTGNVRDLAEIPNPLEVIAETEVDNNVDNHRPEITLEGDNPTVIYADGIAYIDEGATADDNEDGDIEDIDVDASEVDTDSVGTYTVTYTVTDSDGVVATKSRTVEVHATQVATLNVLSVTATQVAVSFPELIGATEIEILQSEDGGDYELSNILEDEIGDDDIAVTVINLIPNTEYTFKIIVTGGKYHYDGVHDSTVDATTAVDDDVVYSSVGLDVAVHEAIATFTTDVTLNASSDPNVINVDIVNADTDEVVASFEPTEDQTDFEVPNIENGHYYIEILDIGEDIDYSGRTNTVLVEGLVADFDAPEITFSPLNAAIDVAIDSDITITFDEAVRNLDDSEVVDGDLAAMLTLKETDAAGADVAFTAIIDVTKQIITITPNANLTNNQVYYVAIGDDLEDSLDNAIEETSITFTTVAE